MVSLGELPHAHALLGQVTFLAQYAFKDKADLTAFLAAACSLAGDTVDGKIYFAEFTFSAAHSSFMFYGEHCRYSNNWCKAEPLVQVPFHEHFFTVRLEGLCFEEGKPVLQLGVSDEMGESDFGICCSSLLQHDLRLKGFDFEVASDHDLDDTSGLTWNVRCSQPLPMLLGVCRRSSTDQEQDR